MADNRDMKLLIIEARFYDHLADALLGPIGQQDVFAHGFPPHLATPTWHPLRAPTSRGPVALEG